MKKESDHFVEETFRGLYYKDEENRLIDILRTNIAAIRDQYKKAIAMTALIRACTKKRPRGILHTPEIGIMTEEKIYRNL